MQKDPSDRLRRAIKENNLYLVRRIIELNTDIKGKCIPPPHVAGRKLRQSRRLDIRNTDPGPGRYTSLAWAAVYGHEEIFEYLLNLGHDEEELSRDAENNTILILLAGVRAPPNTNPQAREYDLQDTAMRMARMYYERYPYLIDWSNIHGKTALHVAATQGHEGFVRMFLDLGADFDLPDLQGNTPLHYASAWNHISILQLLIERGCQFAARNNEGFTASDYAFSFSTMNTLQESARAQFENNKRARRHIFAQAAARGYERERRDQIHPLRDDRQMVDDEPRRVVKPEAHRLRSGSGGSRTNNSILESENTQPARVADSSLSVKLSIPPSAPVPPPKQVVASPVLNNAARPDAPPSPQAPSHQAPPTKSGLAIGPITTTGHTSGRRISPVAARMRERDADAMAEYRTRSGSNGTTSADPRPGPPGPTPSGSSQSNPPTQGAQPVGAPSTSPPTERRQYRPREQNSTDTVIPEREIDKERERGSDILQNTVFRPLRRLRPSNSAASLRPAGIIGVPAGAPAHTHSNSAIEVDLISEVLNSIKTSQLPILAPISSSPSNMTVSPAIGGTRPLDIKPRQKRSSAADTPTRNTPPAPPTETTGTTDVVLPPPPSAPPPAPPTSSNDPPRLPPISGLGKGIGINGSSVRRV